jgi:hypothetical protein
MLYEFLTANRQEILRRARKQVGARSAPEQIELRLTDGLPLFLDQVGDALLLVRAGGRVTHDSISKSAAAHGTAVFRKHLAVEHAIHDYGVLCKVVTDLVTELDAPIGVEAFVTLDLCLDDAIACAVTAWAKA